MPYIGLVSTVSVEITEDLRLSRGGLPIGVTCRVFFPVHRMGRRHKGYGGQLRGEECHCNRDREGSMGRGDNGRRVYMEGGHWEERVHGGTWRQ